MGVILRIRTACWRQCQDAPSRRINALAPIASTNSTINSAYIRGMSNVEYASKKKKKKKPPPLLGKKRLKLLYVTQVRAEPPTFVMFVNDASLVPNAYERYLENAMRRAYGFHGTGLRLIFRSRSEA